MKRSHAVLVLVVLGAIGLLISLGTWVTAEAQTALGPQAVEVSGSSAAPLVPSAALVVMAAGLAMGLSGAVVRYLAPAAAVIASAVAVVAVVGLIGDPAPVARSAAGEAGGLREILGAADLTVWPWVALVILTMTIVVAAVLPFRAGMWAPVGRKYERAAPPGPRAEARADWDALSRGEDPTTDEGAR